MTTEDLLEERLHRLADGIDAPPTPYAADLSRGRRARHRRHAAVTGTALGVALIASAGAAAVHGLTGEGRATGPAYAGGGTATARDPQPTPTARAHPPRHHQVAAPSSTATPRYPSPTLVHDNPQATSDVLLRWREALADDLDPSGTHLGPVSNVQVGGTSLGTKLDWDGGLVEVVVGHAWSDYESFYVADAGLQPTTYQGLDARISTQGADQVVSVRQADGTVVTLIASDAFGNNGTSTSDLGLTQQQLLEAAADPRLQAPDPMPTAFGPEMFSH